MKLGHEDPLKLNIKFSSILGVSLRKLKQVEYGVFFLPDLVISQTDEF